MTRRHRAILEALDQGGWLVYPQGSTTTWRLRMPTDAWYSGQVIQARTVARMRELGLLDREMRPVKHAATRAAVAVPLAPATRIR